MRRPLMPTSPARQRCRAALLALAVFSIVTSSAWAQEPTQARSMAAVRAARPPMIDGTVEDNEWAGAPVATDLVQYEPTRGAPATRRTEARVLYDGAHLYFGFRVWDEAEPAAQLTRRDADVMNDDSVLVLLDSHHDRQSGYLFGTNLLGTQADARVAGDGRTIDRDWDGEWQVATARTDYGWSAEIAIPFASIKYAAGESATWGVNFGRTRRRSLETSFWTGPLDAEFRVSQAGTLTGLTVAAQAQRHRVVPYALTTAATGASPDWQVGVDGRYELTSSATAIAAVNPDFATVEADQERVNLTRFEVSQAEKRQFFMEGAEQFRQRIRTFYSRRIADMSVGAKVLGKQGPWSFAGMYARADPVRETTGADYGILRVQRDLGRSSIGLVAADRSFGGLHQGSVGVDANLFFSSKLGMTAQLVESYGRHGSGSLAFFVRPAFDTPTTHFHVRLQSLGENFGDNVNAVGFVSDDDRREVDTAFEKTFWLTSGLLEQVEYNSNYNAYWSQSGTLRSWEVEQSIDLQLRNRFSAEIQHTEEFKRYEKDFRNRQTSLEVGYNTREFESVQVGYEFGRNYDSDFWLWSVGGAYKVSAGLSLEYDLQRLHLDPDPDQESTWIHVLRASQFFTPDLFLRVFFQTNSVIDRRNVQAVFVYRYQPPFGTLQLVYQRGTAEFGERSDQGNTLFAKATAVF